MKSAQEKSTWTHLEAPCSGMSGEIGRGATETEFITNPTLVLLGVSKVKSAYLYLCVRWWMKQSISGLFPAIGPIDLAVQNPGRYFSRMILDSIFEQSFFFRDIALGSLYMFKINHW